MTAEEGSCAIGGYLARWNLELEGAPWSTPSSHLARVRHRSDGSLALLKVPFVEEERLGSKVLHWWSGDGAVPVHAIDASGAIVMDHAQPGRPSLLSSAESAVPPCWAADTRATATLVAVTQRLHRHQPTHVPEGLIALRRWFRDLFTWADQTGGYFTRAAAIADDLLDHQHDPRVLHGDIHHQNVLWFGPERGWLAIDPKGLYGDPAFDYANLLTNPGRQVILRPGRFDQHVDLITSATGIDRHRLLLWTVAWAGLSAAWHRMPELDGRAADVVEIGLLAECAISEMAG